MWGKNFRNVFHKSLKLETSMLSLYEKQYVTQKYVYRIYSITIFDNCLARISTSHNYTIWQVITQQTLIIMCLTCKYFKEL